MNKMIDKDTRFYIDIDLKSGTIIRWNSGNRFQLEQVLPNPDHHRIFLTTGQYNKLVNKYNTAKK